MGHCVLIQRKTSGYNLISFLASFGFYYARLQCGEGERVGKKHFPEVCSNAACSKHLLCLVSPRLALGLMGCFQNNPNEPVVILDFASYEI